MLKANSLNLINRICHRFMVVSLCASMLGVIGCMDYGYVSVANAQPGSQGYKYFKRIRESSGSYRDSGPLEPGDKFIYVYSFRPSDLDAIGSDRKNAVHKFIEARHAAPPECISGFRVERIGGTESGGVVATIECVSD